MRKLLIMFLAVPLLANAASTARYRGGNALAVADGASGTLETAKDSAITFSTSTAKLVIPYVAIDSYHYCEPAARHLGIAPAIAVGLLRHRQRIHLFRITYHDESGTRVAVFEVPKDSALGFNEFLKAHAVKPTPSDARPAGLPDESSSRATIIPNP
ncbi:MAG TPA: hypothetical protein VH088_01175 [Terriglobales bacterium]|jgi:hypothetical protein|nr:hypothetical protein [Terriglobales bacterium]